MLDSALKEQLRNIFSTLDNHYSFAISILPQHESYNELSGLLDGVASCSDKISTQYSDGEGLEFSLLKNGEDTRIKFRGVPNGHEFTSLLMAILNSDGKGKNIPDQFVQNRVKALKVPIHLTTYVSLTCTNCPDIVQALNLMTTLNPSIHHQMVDGAINQQEVDALKLQGVPAVFADGKLLHVGRGEFGELLSKLENQYGSEQQQSTAPSVKEYDVAVVGGGPAGVSAAIYSARKGLKVALLAERIGGQVKETVGIENLISVSKTTGEELANNLKVHLQDYPVDVLEHRKVEKVEVVDGKKEISVNGGEKIIAPALIIATGASWRKLNVPGESEHIGNGVAFCTHCDGPFYKGKEVAVVGGGNSGIEAAIDLAGICTKVTVVEFMEELKADKVLQEKARSLPNVEIILNTQTTEVVGNGKVSAIKIKDRATAQEREIAVDGIFVQIGLAANSSVFKDLVGVNRFGEIEVDSHCRTNVAGVYAAGDVTTVPYKQIVVAMGEGAKAALSAFEDRIRGVIA